MTNATAELTGTEVAEYGEDLPEVRNWRCPAN
jgi:hypothetical protein